MAVREETKAAVAPRTPAEVASDARARGHIMATKLIMAGVKLEPYLCSCKDCDGSLAGVLFPTLLIWAKGMSRVTSDPLAIALPDRRVCVFCATTQPITAFYKDKDKDDAQTKVRKYCQDRKKKVLRLDWARCEVRFKPHPELEKHVELSQE